MSSSDDTTGEIKLALVIPTLNEAQNIHPLLDRLYLVLSAISWEVLFVDDDSTDGTREQIKERASKDKRIRLIHRIGRKGLSSACLEGILASNAPYVAVMDADLQHDESILPAMYDALVAGDHDLIVGSRYADEGSLGNWQGKRREASKLATSLTRRLTRVQIQDPLSGFFMFRRSAMQPALREASAIGFKLLLDLILSQPSKTRLLEIPYHFRTREAGDSKMSLAVAWELLLLIADKRLGHVIPARFLSFAVIGSSGIAVHFAVLATFHRFLGGDFALAQAIATLAAMTTNFWLNNITTFADHRLRGRAWLKGWLSFAAVCSFGALANVGIASVLFENDLNWAASALAGVVVSAVWNYVVTASYIWHAK